MSRVPSNPYPPPPHPSGPQQLYYPPPQPTGPIGHPPAHLPPHSAYPDSNVYGSYDRSVAATPRPGWNTGGGPHDGGNLYPPQPGPSRMTDSYASYAQPHRSSPNTLPGGRAPAGWSSVHPTSANASGRPDSAARNAVKLEDLVSQDQRAGRPPLSRVTSAVGPTGVAPSTDQRASMNGSNGNNDGGASGSGANGQPSGPSEFIKKLYRMLEEESATYGKGKPAGAKREPGAKRGSVGWGRGGTTFVVWDMNDFTTKVLPQTFRHSNFSSFVRQLNKYGFSKIKHVDEDTGQIKDNVWEFQHPNFQAGGKADLDSIKAVVPKRGGGGGGAGNADDDEPSPRGLSNEDAGRLNEMENRILGLEDQLTKALDEVRNARTREMGIMNVVRDVITHLATIEKESQGASRDADPTPRILHLFQHFDSVASGSARPPSSYGQLPLPFPPQPQMMPFNPPVRLPPVSGVPPNLALGTIPPISMNAMPPRASNHASPHTDGGRSNGDVPSPAPSRGSGHRASISQLVQDPASEDPNEHQGASVTATNSNQTLYNGEPLEMTPIFAETSGWANDGSSASAPMFGGNRRSSDGAALRTVMEALNPAPSMVRFEDVPDPLDTDVPSAPAGVMTTDGAQVAAAAGSNAVVQQSPFGTLVIPNGNDTSVAKPAVENSAIRLRRSTVIKPHWTQTPRILVVEDDVVYRQLSSKFLEKFGCITETVEDAQGAVEKMNATKYDLVLMDIFFGPSMDGRKATSLIRQFDIYTPIISMTSNVQTQDVDSYLQSGMNDVLAKPFTKNGLFGILDKHLIHLKAIQMSAQVPRSLGVPPLSDQGVADAVATGAAEWGQSDVTTIVRNPLAAMGWSDETYQIVLQQYLATGSMPDVNTITDGSIDAINTLGSMNAANGSAMGTIGTSIVFGDSSGFNRKRSIETMDDEWAALTGSSSTVMMPNMMMGGTIMMPSQINLQTEGAGSSKKAKK